MNFGSGHCMVKKLFIACILLLTCQRAMCAVEVGSINMCKDVIHTALIKLSSQLVKLSGRDAAVASAVFGISALSFWHTTRSCWTKTKQGRIAQPDLPDRTICDNFYDLLKGSVFRCWNGFKTGLYGLGTSAAGLASIACALQAGWMALEK